MFHIFIYNVEFYYEVAEKSFGAVTCWDRDCNRKEVPMNVIVPLLVRMKHIELPVNP